MKHVKILLFGILCASINFASAAGKYNLRSSHPKPRVITNKLANKRTKQNKSVKKLKAPENLQPSVQAEPLTEKQAAEILFVANLIQGRMKNTNKKKCSVTAD